VLRSFLAVTGHYMARSKEGHLKLKTALLAFRNIVGGHSGDQLGRAFFDILDEMKITHKVSGFIVWYYMR
jgi:hypothetical protein